MGTLTGSLLGKQMAVDWFSQMTDDERKEMLKKHNITRSIEDGTLLNEDVIGMFKLEKKV